MDSLVHHHKQCCIQKFLMSVSLDYLVTSISKFFTDFMKRVLVGSDIIFCGSNMSSLLD